MPLGPIKPTVNAAVIMEDRTCGICTFCGHEQDGCEPDAHDYRCEDCGECGVYGLEELVIREHINLI